MQIFVACQTDDFFSALFKLFFCQSLMHSETNLLVFVPQQSHAKQGLFFQKLQDHISPQRVPDRTLTCYSPRYIHRPKDYQKK